MTQLYNKGFCMNKAAPFSNVLPMKINSLYRHTEFQSFQGLAKLFYKKISPLEVPLLEPGITGVALTCHSTHAPRVHCKNLRDQVGYILLCSGTVDIWQQHSPIYCTSNIALSTCEVGSLKAVMTPEGFIYK